MGKDTSGQYKEVLEWFEERFGPVSTYPALTFIQHLTTELLKGRAIGLGRTVEGHVVQVGCKDLKTMGF